MLCFLPELLYLLEYQLNEWELRKGAVLGNGGIMAFLRIFGEEGFWGGMVEIWRVE